MTQLHHWIQTTLCHTNVYAQKHIEPARWARECVIAYYQTWRPISEMKSNKVLNPQRSAFAAYTRMLKLTIFPSSTSSSSSSIGTRSTWFSHKSTQSTQAMCRIFVLSSQKHLGINLQTASTLLEKTPLPCHEAPTQQHNGVQYVSEKGRPMHSVIH